jgi:hypothetical protein
VAVVRAPRGRGARLGAALIMLAILVVPLATAFQNDSNDNEPYVRERTCYCHDPLPSTNVTIVLRAPERFALPTKQSPVKVEVGILAPKNVEGIGFGLLLNVSKNGTDVRWDPASFKGEDILNPSVIRSNGSVLWNVDPILIGRWFNVSFIPGRINQTIDVTVIGMRTDHSTNVSGDIWAIKSTKVEVRLQKLINLNVTVNNNEPVTVTDVKLAFYVDDKPVGNSTIGSIRADAKENSTIQWDATFAKDGWHDLRVVIDPAGNITETDKGNNVMTRRFWIGPVPPKESHTLLYGIGAIAVAAVVIGLVLWYRNRRLYKL